MVFIGVVTDSKGEKNILELLKHNNFINKNNVIFIKEMNIDNIKNVHFDTVIINRKFDKMDELNVILKNAKNIVINMDVNIDFKEIEIVSANIVTYGFNSKSSITISSVTEDDVLICVQRNIYNKFGKIDIQEIKLEINERYDIYELIIVVVLFLLYIPNHKMIHINGIK